VVATGDFTMLLPDDEAVYAFTRELAGVRLLVLAHWGAGDVTVEVPDGAAWAGAELLLGSAHTGDPAGLSPDGSWHPGPWDAVVLRLTR
jgi:oligo-1,6-glucosidase